MRRNVAKPRKFGKEQDLTRSAGVRKLPVSALVGVAIFVIEEDCLTGIAARHHMMDRAGEFDA